MHPDTRFLLLVQLAPKATSNQGHTPQQAIVFSLTPLTLIRHGLLRSYRNRSRHRIFVRHRFTVKEYNQY